MKRIALLFVAGVFFCCSAGYASTVTDAYSLSMLDNLEHRPRIFYEKVKTIHAHQPEYSREEISDMIIAAYYTLKSSGKQVTLYDVAEGVRRFSVDELGINFEDLVRAYVDSQLPEQTMR